MQGSVGIGVVVLSPFGELPTEPYDSETDTSEQTISPHEELSRLLVTHCDHLVIFCRAKKESVPAVKPLTSDMAVLE